MRTGMPCSLPDRARVCYRPEYGTDDLKIVPLLQQLEADLDRLDRKQMQGLVLLGIASFLLDTKTSDP